MNIGVTLAVLILLLATLKKSGGQECRIGCGGRKHSSSRTQHFGGHACKNKQSEDIATCHSALKVPLPKACNSPDEGASTSTCVGGAKEALLLKRFLGGRWAGQPSHEALRFSLRLILVQGDHGHWMRWSSRFTG